MLVLSAEKIEWVVNNVCTVDTGLLRKLFIFVYVVSVQPAAFSRIPKADAQGSALLMRCAAAYTLKIRVKW